MVPLPFLAKRRTRKRIGRNAAWNPGAPRQVRRLDDRPVVHPGRAVDVGTPPHGAAITEEIRVPFAIGRFNQRSLRDALELEDDAAFPGALPRARTVHHRRTALLPPADIDDVVPAVALEDLRALAEPGLLDAVIHLRDDDLAAVDKTGQVALHLRQPHLEPFGTPLARINIDAPLIEEDRGIILRLRQTCKRPGFGLRIARPKKVRHIDRRVEADDIKIAVRLVVADRRGVGAHAVVVLAVLQTILGTVLGRFVAIACDLPVDEIRRHHHRDAGIVVHRRRDHVVLRSLPTDGDIRNVSPDGRFLMRSLESAAQRGGDR